MRRIAIGESHPFPRKAIKVRRIHDFVPVATNVAIAEVIGQYDNDVGREILRHGS